MSNADKNTLVPELRFPEFKSTKKWANKPLGKLSNILRGGSPRPIDNFITKDNQGLNWLKIGDVNKNAKYISHTKQRVRIEALNKTRGVHPGDLIMSNSMSFGRPYILQIKTCIHDGWIAVTDLADEIERDFLYYFILSGAAQRYFLNAAAGGGIKNLNADIIKLLKVVYPEEKLEQQKIADCLTSIDDLIVVQTKKLDTLKAHKKGLMQQLFPVEGKTIPKLRFAEFSDAGDWQKRSFSKLFEIGGGKDHKHLPDGDIPVYGSGGYMRSVNSLLYDGESACIGRKGTINKPMFLEGKFWTVDTLFYTHSFMECSPKFVYLLFQNINWLKLNEAGGVPSLSKVIINKVEVKIPSIDEQNKIVKTIWSIDKLITEQSQKITSLKAHKKGLMQKLFPAVNKEHNS
jgi:type I restriction enzyme S subunit